MTHINQRRDDSAVWVSGNPVLHLGEVGWETDTRRSKLGDGTTPWNSLPYIYEPTIPPPPDLSGYAPLDSPTFTGDPKAPTPATSDDDTSIATTAFVKAQGYLDGAKVSNIIAPVKVIAQTAATLSGVGQVFDGYTTQAGDRVLLFGNTTDNGIWQVNAGAWTRPADVDTVAEIPKGTQVWVNDGPVNGQRYWVQMAAAPADFQALIWQVPSYTQPVPTAWLPSSPNTGHTLYDYTRGVFVTWSGTQWLTSALPIATTWAGDLTYAAGTPVWYAGRMWKAKIDVPANKAPALFGDYWAQLGGGDENDWVERDPNFNSNLFTDHWQDFWKFGTVTTTRSTTVGEFETGLGGLKIALGTSSNQRLFNKDETLVRDGEIVTMTVRAKLVSAAAGVTLSANMYQNDSAGAPAPLETGVVSAVSAEGSQALTTSWATYTFTFTAAAGKPRACANILVEATGVAGTVLIDTIRTYRGLAGNWKTYTPTLAGITLGNGALAAAYTRIGKTVHFRVRLTLGSTTTFGGAANSLSLPSAAAAGLKWRFLGEALDTAAGNYPINGTVNGGASGLLLVYRTTAGLTDTYVTNAAPFAIGNGDVVYMAGTYEEA